MYIYIYIFKNEEELTYNNINIIKPKQKKNNEECNNSYTHTQNRITNDMIYLERNSYTIY